MILHGGQSLFTVPDEPEMVKDAFPKDKYGTGQDLPERWRLFPSLAENVLLRLPV